MAAVDKNWPSGSLRRVRTQRRSPEQQLCNLAESNEVQHIQKCWHYSRFVRSVPPRTCDSVLNCLNLRAFYSRRRYLNRLFLIIFSRTTLSFYIDMVGPCITHKSITHFSEWRCAAKSNWRLPNVHSRNIISPFPFLTTSSLLLPLTCYFS
jgi:hypothetical protein